MFTEMGLVPKTCSLPLHGVTKGDVFVLEMPMRPSRAAISVYHWQMPKWFEPLAQTQPTPASRAFCMASCML